MTRGIVPGRPRSGASASTGPVKRRRAGGLARGGARGHEGTDPTAAVVRCGAVPVCHLTPSAAVDHVLSTVSGNRSSAPVGHGVHLVNAWTVVLADGDERLARALRAPSLNLPDGTPVVWAARARGEAVPDQRVRGPQLFLDVLDQGREMDVAHFFLGSTPETLDALVATVSSSFPGVRIVGTLSPPFRPMTDEEVAAQDRLLVETGAEIVWVGLGTPKQDLETTRLATSLPVVAIAVGAAFDFASGGLRVAPRWMQETGLEWLFRFANEPRRLWRRYLIGNLKFVLIAARGTK